MEEIRIEIPQETEENGTWQPPVLTKAEPSGRKSMQNCADVFFMQYVLCVLIVTAVLTIRFFNAPLYETLITQFCAHTQSPTESAVEQVIALVQAQWS